MVKHNLGHVDRAVYSKNCHSDGCYYVTFVSSSSTSVVIEISSELVLGDTSSVGGWGVAVPEIGVVIPTQIY